MTRRQRLVIAFCFAFLALYAWQGTRAQREAVMTPQTIAPAVTYQPRAAP